MQKNQLKENLIYSVIFQIVAFITPLITSPYLSRVLGAEGIGLFSYSQAFANYFFLFAMLGVNNYGNRSIARAKENREQLSQAFWQIYYMQLFLTVIVGSAYLGFCFFFQPKAYRLIFLIQGLQILSVVTDINWFAFGLEKFKLTTIRNLTVKILTIISIFLLVKTPNDVWKYALLLGVGTIGGLLVVWPLVHRETDFKRPKINEILSHIKPNLILFIPLLATSIYQNMDKIMLGKMVDQAAVGFYTYAENILNIGIAFITAICTVLMPRISNMISNENEENAKVLFEKGFHYTSILEIALCFGCMAIAERFVPLYLGNGYTETANLLKILAAMIFLSGAANVLRMAFLIPKGFDRLYVFAIVFGASVNLIGNFILIPRLGATGACIATLLSYASVLFVQLYGTRKSFPYVKWLLRLVPYIILGFGMFFTIKAIDGLKLNSWLVLGLEIGLGGIIFCVGSILILKLIEKDKTIFHLLKRKK